jgi:hypothetical protein
MQLSILSVLIPFLLRPISMLTGKVVHFRAFSGAHVQFASNAAMLGVGGLAINFVDLSARKQRLATICLIIGAYVNPFMYCFASLTGYCAEPWLQNQLFEGLKADPKHIYTRIVEMCMATTAITDYAGLFLLTYGLWKGRKAFWNNNSTKKAN